MADGQSILHILPAEPYGGLQSLVIELARAQRATGQVVDILLLGASDRVETRCREVGIEPFTTRGPKLSQLAALSGILRRVRPDILHSHCEPIWATAMLAASKAIWISHQHVYANQSSLRDRVGNALRKRRVDLFIAITCSVAASFIEPGLVCAERSTVVYNGIDVTSLHPGVNGVDQGPFVVAFIGRAVREKGLFDVIEIAAMLQSDPGIAFVIAGEGGDLDEARARIQAHGLCDRITILGFVDDVATLWKTVDMLLMLSWREPFGLVILEAIASGAAVLGYDTPSGGTEIMNAIPGCDVVAPFSIEALSGRVRHAARNRLELTRQVTDGQRIITERFSLSNMERNIAREYRRARSRS